MRPPFQRNPVWTELQQSYLIDTILRGYPIPELYMLDIVEASAKQTYIVVDGQQRIRACLDFLAGQFNLDSEQSPEYGEVSFDDLPDADKQRIYSYSFVVRLLPPTDDAVLRGIFQRLNRNNVVLNQQELRQATYWGPFLQTMKRLAENEAWTEFGIFTANDVRRMLDVEYISELAVGLIHGPQNKKHSLDKWYEAYEKEFEQEHVVESTFATVLGELMQLLSRPARTRWRKKSDFYTLFLVFAAHVGSLPLASDKRILVATILESFQSMVTEYLATLSPTQNTEDSDAEAETRQTQNVVQLSTVYPSEVVRYAGAVQRAASDLANRRTRARELEAALAGIWAS
jgi:hypothetical protein